MRHLGGRFDTGKAAAGNNHRVARSGFREAAQLADVFFQLCGIGKLVDVEGVGEARDIRTEQDAPGCKNKLGVADRCLPPVIIRVGNGVVCRRDGLRIALDESNASIGKDLGQGRLHPRRVLLIETGANVEFGLRRDHGNLDGTVRLSLLVQ